MANLITQKTHEARTPLFAKNMAGMSNFSNKSSHNWTLDSREFLEGSVTKRAYSDESTCKESKAWFQRCSTVSQSPTWDQKKHIQHRKEKNQHRAFKQSIFFL